MAKLNKNVIAALQAIQASGRVSKDIGEPLLAQNLIVVDTSDLDDNGDAAATLTQLAIDSLPKPKNTSTVTDSNNSTTASSFAIITDAVPPESKRGKGREAGVSKYPFDDLPVNGSFFVAKSAEIPEPLKTLGSAVSNATNKYREETGQFEDKTRTKRGEGNKAALDQNGQKIKETVKVPVYKYNRKFVMRGVTVNQKCGNWTAPADGVLITRTK